MRIWLTLLLTAAVCFFAVLEADVRATDHSPFGEDSAHSHGGTIPDADEVEARLHDALIALTRGEMQRGEAFYRYLREQETGSGLTDNFLDLLNSYRQERDAYIQAQEDALDEELDPRVKRLVRKRLNTDELLEAGQLLREDKVVKAGRLYNIVLRNLNLFDELSVLDLVSFHLGAVLKAGERTFSLLGDLWKFGKSLGDIDARERKALHLYETFLKKWPNSQEVPAVEKRVEKLRKKLREHFFDRELKLARQASKEAHHFLSLFHYRNALALSPESRQVREEMQNLEGQRKAVLAAEEQALAVAGSEVEFQDADAQKDYQEILYALSVRDGPRLQEASQAFLKRHPDSPLAEDGRAALALACEWEGNYQGAKDHLRRLAEQKDSSLLALQASALLHDPTYDLYGSFKARQKGHVRSSVEYIAFGKSLHFNREESDAFDWAKESFGLGYELKEASANDALRRAFDLFVLRKAFTDSALIALGEMYLLRDSQSDRAVEVRRALVEAYEKRKDYQRALIHSYALPDVSSQRSKELEEKAADHLLHVADRSEGGGQERALYAAKILELYPTTAAAQKLLSEGGSGRQLFGFQEEEAWIAKALLQAHPVLRGPEGLNLKEELFDGDPTNGEMAGKGILFSPSGLVKVAYHEPDGFREEEFDLGEETWARFSALVWEVNYAQGEKQLDEGLVRMLDRYEKKGLLRFSGGGLSFGPSSSALPSRRRAQRLELELELLSPEKEAGVASLTGGEESTSHESLHALPGLLINLDLPKGKEDKEDDQNTDTVQILGRSLAMQGQARTRDYILGYRFWEDNKLAVGKFYYTPWDTRGKLGLAKKGPSAQFSTPVPWLKKTLPLTINTHSNLKGIRLTPVMVDPKMDDGELYGD